MAYIVFFKGINIEAKGIKVVKDWFKLKSGCNIQIFLGFIYFNWQFIQDFNRIVALLTAILKTIELLDKPAFNRNNSSKLGCSKNHNNRPGF